MCVTCTQHDPRKVRWIAWLQCRKKHWAQALFELIEESTDEQIEAAQAAWRKVFTI